MLYYEWNLNNVILNERSQMQKTQQIPLYEAQEEAKLISGDRDQNSDLLSFWGR